MKSQAFASLSYAAVLGIAMLARAASNDNDYAHKQPMPLVSVCKLLRTTQDAMCTAANQRYSPTTNFCLRQRERPSLVAAWIISAAAIRDRNANDLHWR